MKFILYWKNQTVSEVIAEDLPEALEKVGKKITDLDMHEEVPGELFDRAMNKVVLTKLDDNRYRLYGIDHGGSCCWGGKFFDQKMDALNYYEVMRVAFSLCGKFLYLDDRG